jgi:sn-glycerol 3-phosphate transport system substrate-binding protein
VDSGAFIPVQACVDAADYPVDDYLDRAVETFSVDGVLWPMPFNIANQILYANNAMLTEAGVDELPTTLAEVRAAAQAVVDSGLAPSGLALTSSPWLIEQLFALADVEIADGANGRDNRARQLLIDNDLGLEIFTWLNEMVADGLAVFVGDGADIEQYLSLGFGRTAMVMDTSAALRGVVDAAATLPALDLVVGPLPAVGERAGGMLVSGAGLWLDADTTDVERAAVWDFMVFATRPEVQARWHADTGYVPVRASAIERDEVTALWANEPEFRVAYDQLVEGVESSATAGLVIGNHAQIRIDAFIPALESMYLQGVDPQTALSRAQADADAMIADYNRRTGN